MQESKGWLQNIQIFWMLFSPYRSQKPWYILLVTPFEKTFSLIAARWRHSYIFQSFSTIWLSEAAGFWATERFSLTGFLSLSLRICHLQTWHSGMAYFLCQSISAKTTSGDASPESWRQSVDFSYCSGKQPQTLSFRKHRSVSID